MDDLFVRDVADSAGKPAARKALLGQFMTPPGIARFMAGLFSAPLPADVCLLDAGAGMGALTAAFVARWRKSASSGTLVAHAYEVDADMIGELRPFLDAIGAESISVNLFEGDFIERAATMIRLGRGPRYTHAILNPPYKKINTLSAHRSLLSAAGLETVNLYSGFVGLALDLLDHGGEIVAIIPRSFCNGPYYQSFRRFILGRAAIKRIHLFEARDKAFRDEGVLQENIVLHLVRGATQGSVEISTSKDDGFEDLAVTTHSFDRIVFPDDAEQFIHIPTGTEGDKLLGAAAFRHSLAELGISVSTGPVVDFRMRDDLRANPEADTVPLLYPGHFNGDSLEWPRQGFKKPNAIRLNAATRKWLYPNGYYAVVRRFSSKEERRRIVASVIDPSLLPGEVIGLENHLNVFHEGRKPLSEEVARGLAVFLNTTMVDQYFRRFNGHTQVNAADLRTIPFPSRAVLMELGRWAKNTPAPTQSAIDDRVSAAA